MVTSNYIQFNAAYATHKGIARTSNQDCGSVNVSESQSKMPLLSMAIADGMGNKLYGGIASAMTILTVDNLIVDRLDQSLDLVESIHNVVERSGINIRKMSLNRGYSGIGSTLVSLFSIGREAYISNIGDSRCYILRSGCLEQVTQDHNYLQELLDDEVLVRSEIDNNFSKVLTRVIGVKDKEIIDSHTRCLAPGDKVLLSSDGLHDYVGDQDIKNILEKEIIPETTCEKLINSANEAGGTDDVSVAVAICT